MCILSRVCVEVESAEFHIHIKMMIPQAHNSFSHIVSIQMNVHGVSSTHHFAHKLNRHRHRNDSDRWLSPRCAAVGR